jgi:hypothetical protein
MDVLKPDEVLLFFTRASGEVRPSSIDPVSRKGRIDAPKDNGDMVRKISEKLFLERNIGQSHQSLACAVHIYVTLDAAHRCEFA